MQTQTTQIRVTLPNELTGYLQTKASKFGLSLSIYIKNLVINDVQDVKYPIYEMSSASVKNFNEAKKEEKNGTLIKVSGIFKIIKKK